MNVPPDQLQPFVKLPRGLAPFGYRNFLLFWIGFATSNAGRWIELTGALWLVYELTDSPLLLGVLGIARAVPGIILSPIAGVVADRIDQRPLLITTQALSLVVSLGLGLLILTGHIQLWQVYAGVALQSAIASFDAGARQALFPRFIPRAHLPSAVTLSITAARLAKFIGPVVGGFTIAGIGEAAPFLLNAASFLVLMPAVALIRGLAPETGHVASSLVRDLTEGVRYILSAPVLSGLFKMELVFGILEMNAVMIAIIARERLGVGPEAMGLLLAAPALGSFVGITWLVFLGHSSRQGRFSLICTIAYAAALLLVAVSHNYAMSLGALALIGILDAFTTVTRNSVVQLAAPPRMRGRVMASMGIVTRGVSPLAETQSGLLAGVIGPTYAVVGAAAALAIAAGLTARLNPALWRFSLTDAHGKPADPASGPPGTS